MIEEQKKVIVRNIKKLLKENKMTQSDLAEKIEIAKSTMSDYMNYRAKPSSGVLEKMARVFGVTKSDIDTTYKNMQVGIIANELVLNERDTSYEASEIKIPIIGKISAGQPIEAIEDIVDEVYPSYDIANPSEVFGLVVHGESMNKIAPSGNYAIIRKQQEVENGEIAAVIVNGHFATLKKVYKFTDLIILEPYSYDERYTDQKYSQENCDDIKIIGKFLYTVSPMF
ncbi:LexA family protein [Cytobacillus purgationiresistens]|uniref:Repressor LexA n=1 Tax=Cytobacillus purgationiresistens TaxID=863449 RepID=A0ABU0ADV8_9BACI|nr:LexA family transcriptional regulator [Cytobacillus purgationiresistens]MDQ0268926.1 repressor LexA [Cytobacillus purgationiresistens]